MRKPCGQVMSGQDYSQFVLTSRWGAITRIRAIFFSTNTKFFLKCSVCLPGTRHLERGINVFKIETYSRFKTYSKFLFRTNFFSQNSKYNVFRLFFIFLKWKNFSFYESSNAATINFLILATLFSPPSFHSLHHHFILSPIDFRTWTNDCFVAA